MNINKYKAIVFDIDGTLIDTTKGIRASADFIAKKYNLETLTDDNFKKFISYAPISKSFACTYEIGVKLSQKLGTEWSKHYKKNNIYNADVYSNVFQLLSFIKNNNLKLGIATFKNQDNANLLLKKMNLSNYFNVICGSGNNTQETKTNILYNCLTELNCAAENILFVGDTITDAIASKELSIDFIAVTYGFGFKENINITYDSVFIAKNACEIIQWLRG